MATWEKTEAGTYKFVVRRMYRGRRFFKAKTFKRKPDGTRWAARLERMIDADEDLVTPRRAPTLAELIDAYAAHQLELDVGPEKSRRHRRRHLGWWKRRLGHRPVDRVSGRDIGQALRAICAGEGLSGRPASPKTGNRYLAAIRSVCRFGTKEDWLEPAENPCRGMALPESKGRLRYLRPEEISRLLDAVRGSGRLELFVVIGLTTGARLAEIERMRWSHVDWAAGTILIEDTKTDEPRLAPLSDAVRELLSEAPRPISGHLMVGPRGGVKLPREEWKEALRRAGLEDVVFHTLRHTAASLLVQAGKSLLQVGQLLGHKSHQATKIYAHLRPEMAVETGRELEALVFDQSPLQA